MNPADSQPVAAVQTIPLDKLEVSPGNVRKTDAGLQAFAELTASIAAHGLISNLVVRPVADDPERFAVVAGARRYSALSQLAADGQVPTDMPVPEGYRGFQDESGRLWDVLHMARHYALAASGRGRVRMCILVREIRKDLRDSMHPPRKHFPIVAIGAGDAGEPVITIMFPEDD